MSRTFFTFFSGAFFPMKNCTQIFINSNFVLLQIHMKLRQFTNLGKLSTLIHTELFQSLYISGRKLWGPDTNANPYELWCIITAFQIRFKYVSNTLQRIKTVNKMWCYKLGFPNYVFEQNIIFYIKGKTKDIYCCYLAFPVFFVILPLHFWMFFFFLHSSFFQFFCILSPNQENHDSK